MTVVLEQLVLTAGSIAGPVRWTRRELRAGEVSWRVLEEKEVETTVAVVVEESGVGGEAIVVDPVLRRGFRERPIPVVDEKEIPAVLRLRSFGAGHRDVDIEKSVAVDVDHRGSGGPPLRAHPRALGDVLEAHVPLVQVEATRHLVAAEKEVGEPVVVDVP